VQYFANITINIGIKSSEYWGDLHKFYGDKYSSIHDKLWAHGFSACLLL